MLMQLAEAAYPKILDLLANKPKAKRQGKQSIGSPAEARVSADISFRRG
jgi:hypothetical protein